MVDSTSTFIKTAGSIGARVSRDALWAGNECNWAGPSLELVDGCSVVLERTFGADLYSGTTRIALFLAELFSITEERVHSITACGAAQNALIQAADPARLPDSGLYSGSTGVGAGLFRVGELLGDEEIKAAAIQTVLRGAEGVLRSSKLDVISGSAGIISALLSIPQWRDDDRLLSAAIRHGDHIIDCADRDPRGWSWNTLPGATRDNPIGFAHGAAGIALSLLELAQASGDVRFREAAFEGFRYEQHWYNSSVQNWPDLRYDSMSDSSEYQDLTYGVTWCHGACGIGFTRLRAYEIAGEESLRHQGSIAVRSVTQTLTHFMSSGMFTDCSLCHGGFGNVDLLLYASIILQDPQYQQTAEEFAIKAADMVEANRLTWPCGVPNSGETPSLMLGLAGIGQCYLRLARPLSVPSVLLFGRNASEKKTGL